MSFSNLDVLLKSFAKNSKKTKNINSQNLTDKELHRELFFARNLKYDYVEIHSDNETYYLFCEFNNGGYTIAISLDEIKINLSIMDSPFIKRCDWYSDYKKNKIFGISEIIKINKSILKLNQLQVFR